MKKKTNWAKTKRYLPLYLMLLPGAAYLIINNYLPMAGLVLAFKKVNYNVGLFQSPWTGLSNFKYLFTTKDAFIFFRNTILYNLAFIFFGNLMGIITAVALDSIRKKFSFRHCTLIRSAGITTLNTGQSSSQLCICGCPSVIVPSSTIQH